MSDLSDLMDGLIDGKANECLQPLFFDYFEKIYKTQQCLVFFVADGRSQV